MKIRVWTGGGGNWSHSGGWSVGEMGLKLLPQFLSYLNETWYHDS